MLDHRKPKASTEQESTPTSIQSAHNPGAHTRAMRLPLLAQAIEYARDRHVVESALQKLAQGSTELALSVQEKSALQSAVKSLRDAYQAQLLAHQNFHSFDYSAPESDWAWREEVLKGDSRSIRLNEILSHLEFEFYLLELAQQHPHGFLLRDTLYTRENEAPIKSSASHKRGRRK